MRIILTAQAPGGLLSRLTPIPGPGSLVCCAPQPDAVATAQRLYPDRRIEVKTLYREPGLHQGRWLLAWMLMAKPGEESHEDVRRRIIDTSVRLIGVAKEEDEAVFVGGPRLLRMLAIKLNSIGYRGPLLGTADPMRAAEYSYLA
jgi:hypothetical protein